MSATYSGLELRTPLPASVTAPSTEGLRRGAAYDNDGNWKWDEIWMDWKATAPVTMATNTYGVHTMVETVPGQKYMLWGRVKGGYASTAQMNAGAKTVALTIGTQKSVDYTLTAPTGERGFVPIEFTADSSLTSVGVVISQQVTGTAGSVIAKLAIYDMHLTALDFEYPQRLRNNVFNSSLANHFDLACNSIGASWHVDKSGVAQFLPPAKYLPVRFVFSDEDGTEFLKYVDLEPQHATTSIINHLEVTNLGASVEAKEDNSVTTWTDQPSISKYGLRKDAITVNLSEWMNNPGLSDLVENLMASRTAPRLAIAKVIWNAQQNLEAAMRLELGQRVVVRFRGEEYDAQIAYLQHDITPTRWLITITLRLP